MGGEKREQMEQAVLFWELMLDILEMKSLKSWTKQTTGSLTCWTNIIPHAWKHSWTINTNERGEEDLLSVNGGTVCRNVTLTFRARCALKWSVMVRHGAERELCFIVSLFSTRVGLCALHTEVNWVRVTWWAEHKTLALTSEVRSSDTDFLSFFSDIFSVPW